jgi:hypothetical protein
MQFDEVLRTWKDFFEREGIRYALIGGLAMRAWGSGRTTEDVDFVVEIAAKPQRKGLLDVFDEIEKRT